MKIEMHIPGLSLTLEMNAERVFFKDINYVWPLAIYLITIVHLNCIN